MTETGRLFELDPLEPAAPVVDGPVVRVLPDVSGLVKEFDYLVPESVGSPPPIGSLVRVELNGRSVTGWVTALDVEPPAGTGLRPLTAVVSVGPDGPTVELARWAAHRWSGRVGSILKTASPPRRVRSITEPGRRPAVAPRAPEVGAVGDAVEVRAGADVVAVPLSPTADVVPLLLDAAERGNALVVTPSVEWGRLLAGRLRRQGVTARVHPSDWAASAGRGGVVLGARSAVWARVPDLATIVVLDEHDERLQEERNPTWHARSVAIERARRLGIPCWLVSPCPSVAATAAATSWRRLSRSEERRGWPLVEVIDRRPSAGDLPGLFSSRVAELVRQPGSILAVLNRKGRAVRLACSLCGELALTEDGERLMVERDGHLECLQTGETRPVVCASCGSTALKRLRLGVSRAAEELGALAGEPVDELTAGSSRPAGSSETRIVVGTEAALHQLTRVDTVVFLDFDAELLAPRYRAGEQALALLARAARLVGGRADGGRVVIQTRTPDHRVIDAAVRADPGRFVAAELELRQALRFPPAGALAELSGSGAAELAEGLGTRADLEIFGPRHDGRYLVRADDPGLLADALAEAERPASRVRVAVDPPRA